MSYADDYDYMIFPEDMDKITGKNNRREKRYLKFTNALIYLESEKAYYVSFPDPINDAVWIPKSQSYKVGTDFLISEWMLNKLNLSTG
jgi:hypothetical protein